MDKTLMTVWAVCVCIAFWLLTLAEYLFTGKVRRKIFLRNIIFSLSFSPIAVIFGAIFCVIACKERNKKESE